MHGRQAYSQKALIYIDQLVGGIDGDPGNNGHRVCGVGSGCFPVYGMRKMKDVEELY